MSWAPPRVPPLRPSAWAEAWAPVWARPPVKGHKGAKARSGGGKRPGFEGGQMPLYRRVPKKGFTNIFRTEYATVNVGQLEAFDNGAVVTAAMLKEAKIIRKTLDGVKVLGNGELTKKLTVEAAKFTASAKEKIEALGGKAEVK